MHILGLSLVVMGRTIQKRSQCHRLDRAHMLTGIEVGAVGMEDSGGDAYEAKTGLGPLDSGQPVPPL